MPSRPIRHFLLGAFLALLLVTALAPAPAAVVDLLTGEPVAGARLDPIDPFLRDALEPLYGPVHLVSSVPEWRLVSWFAWIALTWFAARLAWRWRWGELPRKLLPEIAFLFGGYVLLAVAPLPFIWLSVIEKDLQKFLTPVGLPLAGFLAWLAYVLTRPSARGHRGRVILRTLVGFVGILGFLSFGLFALVFLLPGTWRTGMRLVPPEGFVSGDLHSHSQTAQDAIVSGPDRLDIYRGHGIRINAITEHNAFDVVDEPGDSTYFTLLPEAEKRGILLLPGEEFTTHAVHLTLFGVRRTFRSSSYRLTGEKDQPPDYGYDYPRLIRDVHAEGGYVVVAHWWTPRQWTRIDWERLVSWGVDGFEIATDSDRAPPEALEAWKRTGLMLLAGSDFHGWRRSLYCWTLFPEEAVREEPYTLIDRLFRERNVRLVGAGTHDPAVPVWLDPPANAWRYFAAMRPGGRVSWAVLALAAWWFAGRRGRRWFRAA